MANPTEPRPHSHTTAITDAPAAPVADRDNAPGLD
jgi:hypothetical protein